MIIEASSKIGSNVYKFILDEKDDMDTLHSAAVLSNPRRYCDECKAYGLKEKYLDSNKDKEGNIYVNLVCKCGAKSKLGLYKAGGYFWHKYEKYVPKD